MTFLDRLNSTKFHFTQILSDGKIIKFKQTQTLTSHFERAQCLEYIVYVFNQSKLLSKQILIKFQHLRRSFKPTDIWYENEHRELMLLDSSAKESPILAFNRGRAYANRSSTEVQKMLHKSIFSILSTTYIIIAQKQTLMLLEDNSKTIFILV